MGADTFIRQVWSGRPGGDRRAWSTGTVLAVDDVRHRVTVSTDDGRVDALAVDGDYAEGDTVALVLDPWGVGTGALVVGTVGATPATYPTTGTVVSATTTTASVSTSIGTVTARIPAITLVASDQVRMDWPGGEPWVLFKLPSPATAPSAPSAPTVTLAGSTWTATWSAVSGASSYLVRYSTDAGASWSTPRTVTGTSTTGTLAEGQTVYVQVEAVNSGGMSGWSSSGSVTYPETPSTETATAVIRPTWSGTYRDDRSDWDRWNIYRSDYGGRSTLYQGDAHGSGALRGLAVYGTQVRDLGAISIQRIRVVLRGADLVESTYPDIDVRGSAQGTAAPSGGPVETGDTVTGSPGRDGVAKVALTSTQREDFRTGALRGLVVTGTGYGAVRGTSASDGMALLIDYTRTKA